MATRNKFPDLTGPRGKKDKKITQADILAAKGVIPKASESFIDEVMSRVEENILLEEEHIQNVLTEAEENGIDVNYLTEEELSELFGFGMDTRTSRDAVKRQQIRRKAQRSRRGQRAAMMDRLAKVSAERKAAKAKDAKPKDSAVSNLARGARTPNRTTGSGGDLFQRKQAQARAAKEKEKAEKLKADTGDRHRGGMGDSTDIVRGARLALAERVLDQILEGDVPMKLRKPKKDPAAEKERLRTIMYGHKKGGTAIKPGQPIPKPGR